MAQAHTYRFESSGTSDTSGTSVSGVGSGSGSGSGVLGLGVSLGMPPALQLQGPLGPGFGLAVGAPGERRAWSRDQVLQVRTAPIPSTHVEAS